MDPSWKFITARDEDLSAWCWVQCLNGRVVQRSVRTFETFPACLLDAQGRGFRSTHPFDVFRDRRRTGRLAA